MYQDDRLNFCQIIKSWSFLILQEQPNHKLFGKWQKLLKCIHTPKYPIHPTWTISSLIEILSEYVFCQPPSFICENDDDIDPISLDLFLNAKFFTFEDCNRFLFSRKEMIIISGEEVLPLSNQYIGETLKIQSGSIGFEIKAIEPDFNATTHMIGNPFIIVWIHPSLEIMGVIYPLFRYNDFKFPVHLIFHPQGDNYSKIETTSESKIYIINPAQQQLISQTDNFKIIDRISYRESEFTLTEGEYIEIDNKYWQT